MADNVLGTLFGDIANAIRTKTGDTAKMKPIDFPTKILGIEVGGATTVDIIPEQELTFVYDESAGVYTLGGHNLFNITSIALGKEYKVVWGSEEFSCTAIEGLFSGQYPMIGIGNPYAIGGENNNMPFAIGYITIPDYGSQYTCIIASLDGSATKNVRVYEATAERKLTATTGDFTPQTDKTVHTITHGLGVVPDLIIITPGFTIKESDMATKANTIYGGFAFSKAILDALPSEIRGAFGVWWAWIGGSFGFTNTGNPDGLDCAESSTNKIFGRIQAATDTTFMVGGTTNHMPAGFTYHWYAVTGLFD